MGRYVQLNLAPGEQVIYEAKIHLFGRSGTQFGFILTLSGVIFLAYDYRLFGVLSLWIGLATLLPALIAIANSEMAITDRRVLIKVGWKKKTALDMDLLKVESVAFDQDLLGEWLNFGTVMITGTGGTSEVIEAVKAPLEFKRAIATTIENRRAAS